MNYFGHAALAVMKGGSEGFILGAMLPDLAPIAGIQSPNGFDDPTVQQGVDFHIETDALFHQTATFITLNRNALADLRRAGVSRGPARACAHMGVEMLIDAQLIQTNELQEGYLRALEYGALTPKIFSPLDGSVENSLRGLCEHLKLRGQAVHDVSVERFQLRLGRTLAPRARLAPTPDELDIIAKYLCTVTAVGPAVPQLLHELRPLVDTRELENSSVPSE